MPIDTITVASLIRLEIQGTKHELSREEAEKLNEGLSAILNVEPATPPRKRRSDAGKPRQENPLV